MARPTGPATPPLFGNVDVEPVSRGVFGGSHVGFFEVTNDSIDD